METEKLQLETLYVWKGHDIYFLRTLGPTYQLILLTASQSNFAKVVDKAIKVELAIRARLVQDAPPTPTNSTRQVPKKSIVPRLEANAVQVIEVSQPSQSSGYVLP